MTWIGPSELPERNCCTIGFPLDKMSSGGPSSTILPSYSMAIRWAIFIAPFTSWLMMKKVIPSFFWVLV